MRKRGVHSDSIKEAAPSTPRAIIRKVVTSLPTNSENNSAFTNGMDKEKEALFNEKTGVLERRITRPGETALDLAEEACIRLFRARNDIRDRIDTIVFCTQSPDHVVPSNACILHGRLEMRNSVAAFDLSLACSAFVYALHIVQALIASGAARNVLIINADTYSKYVHPFDRSTRSLFGDGATAAWIGASSDGRGILDTACCTDGTQFDKFYIPAGGCRLPLSDQLRGHEHQSRSGNICTDATVHMSGREILDYVRQQIPRQIVDVLKRNRFNIDEIDWFVFHQASGIILDTLTTALSLPPCKVLRSFQFIGNLSSASIPAALQAGISKRLFKKNHLILLCGFGAGLSWGTVLMRY